jgi:FMN phosphatase YigB (HAD superfamily)
VVEALGVQRQDCFFAGDSEDKDFLGPRRFGMRGSFLIDPSRPSRECGIVSSIGEIPSFFCD